MSTDILLNEVRKLSVADRMRLLEEIWDTIGTEETGLPLAAEQREELDLRLKEHAANPQPGATWPEVRAQIEHRP